jgi:hypothetical protein
MNKEDKEMWLTIIGFYLIAGVAGYLISEFILK